MSSSAMTSNSSSTTTTIPSILAIPVSEKLTKSNYPLWSAQVLSAIQAARLHGLLIGVETPPPAKEITTVVADMPVKQSNPAYTAWVARHQSVLGYLLSTLA
jgi:hypothetical protein